MSVDAVKSGQCPRCGTANSYSSPVCEACGSRLPWAEAIDTARRQAIAESAAQASQQKSLRLPTRTSVPASSANTSQDAAMPQTHEQGTSAATSVAPMAPASNSVVQSATSPASGASALPFPTQYLAFFGAGLLLIGLFLPIATVPIIGSVNLTSSRDVGGIVFVCALATVLLSVYRQYRWLWLSGGVAFLTLTYNFFNLTRMLGQLRSGTVATPSNDPAEAIGQAMGEVMAKAVGYSVQLQWGWIVLFAGAGLIVASAALTVPPRTLWQRQASMPSADTGVAGDSRMVKIIASGAVALIVVGILLRVVVLPSPVEVDLGSGTASQLVPQSIQRLSIELNANRFAKEFHIRGREERAEGIARYERVYDRRTGKLEDRITFWRPNGQPEGRAPYVQSKIVTEEAIHEAARTGAKL